MHALSGSFAQLPVAQPKTNVPTEGYVPGATMYSDINPKTCPSTIATIDQDDGLIIAEVSLFAFWNGGDTVGCPLSSMLLMGKWHHITCRTATVQ